MQPTPSLMPGMVENIVSPEQRNQQPQKQQLPPTQSFSNVQTGVQQAQVAPEIQASQAISQATGNFLGNITEGMQARKEAAQTQNQAQTQTQGQGNAQPMGQAESIAAAIKQVESGGNYKIKGGSGEHGAYQFMPNTWKEWAGKFLGDSNAQMTPENQDRVAISKINELINQGYSPEQIALIWNGGEPVRKAGVNKFGVKYDSGAYADKVLGALNKLQQAAQMEQRPNKKFPNLTGTKLSDLGTFTTPYGGSTRIEKFHPGVDIANKLGTPIPAFASGTVTDIVRGKKQDMKGGYGNYVIVTDANGNQHRYSHLLGDYVQVGQKVQQGQVLGKMGNTGASYSTSGGTGSHLDYRIKNAAGKYLNPNSFLKQFYG